jgi:MFS transporter, FHS family, Na+ dependent glucose transporter 1
MATAPNVSRRSRFGAGRWEPTAAYFLVFGTLGLILASFGPALPYLAARIGRTVDELAPLFAVRAMGSIGGSLIGGHLYDRRPGHPVLALMLVCLAAALSLFPNGWLLSLLAVALLFAGFCEGMLGVGLNTLLGWEHPGRAAPFLNGMHFAFGLGAFLAPLFIVASFRLSGYVASGYLVLALTLLPMAFWLIRLPSPAPLAAPPARSQPHTIRTDRYLLFALIAFLALYVGAEVGFGGWIYTYALERQLAPEAGAALLNSAYWGALTIGRLASIPLAARWRLRYLLPAHLLAALASLALFLIVSHPLAAWAGTIAFGLALAPIFPNTLAFAGRRLQLSSRVTSWMMIGGSLGAMIVPWLLGRIFGAWGAQAIMAALLVDLALSLLLLLALRTPRRVDQSA